MSVLTYVVVFFAVLADGVPFGRFRAVGDHELEVFGSRENFFKALFSKIPEPDRRVEIETARDDEEIPSDI